MDEKLEKTYSYSFLADTKEGNFQVGRKLEENFGRKLEENCP